MGWEGHAGRFPARKTRGKRLCRGDQWQCASWAGHPSSAPPGQPEASHKARWRRAPPGWTVLVPKRPAQKSLPWSRRPAQVRGSKVLSTQLLQAGSRDRRNPGHRFFKAPSLTGQEPAAGVACGQPRRLAATRRWCLPDRAVQVPAGMSFAARGSERNAGYPFRRAVENLTADFGTVEHPPRAKAGRSAAPELMGDRRKPTGSPAPAPTRRGRKTRPCRRHAKAPPVSRGRH